MSASLPHGTDAAQTAQPAPAAPAAPGLSAVEAEPAWRAAARRAAEVAARHADEVDREARFPAEAFEVLRRERLLSALVPAAFGGAGLSLADIAAICETLAQACASTAMIYAMHQIQVACIEAHHDDSPWQHALLDRIVRHQWLLASATSEATIGGNMRTSACAVELDDGHFRLEKLASTISYGAHADGILVTARRTAESTAADQVLVVALRTNTELERYGSWDALGMRGTCSEGFRLVARGLAAQILSTPFAEIANRTLLPVSHTLWAAVWTGIATNAVNRAKAFFHAQARANPGANPGATPPAGLRLATAVGLLQMMQARLAAALDAVRAARRAGHDGSHADAPLSALLGFASDMNMLKTSMSTTALQIVQEVLMICGMAGYKNDTEYSVGRHLRDLHSAPLMINNDRIAQNTASLLLAQRPTAS